MRHGSLQLFGDGIIFYINLTLIILFNFNSFMILFCNEKGTNSWLSVAPKAFSNEDFTTIGWAGYIWRFFFSLLLPILLALAQHHGWFKDIFGFDFSKISLDIDDNMQKGKGSHFWMFLE